MKTKSLSPAVLNYIVSPTQQEIDLKMVPYDIWGTMAHVIMLQKTGILSLDKAAKILKALQEINIEDFGGDFKIDPQKGAQLTLEGKIVEKAGESAGLSAHTARSRNDQVMVTELLYLKEEYLNLTLGLVNLSAVLLDLASKHVSTVFPGYTHMQPAKPTTFAHWCLAYCDGIFRVVKYLQNAFELYDLCPLGAAESYGTSWPIDRDLAAKLLDFGGVWEVPQDAISSRGLPQLAVLDGLNQFGVIASKLATDLLLYSTFEYGLVIFGDQVSQRLHPITGSSIMAQKKNPDVLELVRSTAPQISGFHQIVTGILSALPSGYNRDSREVKEYIGLAIDKVNATIGVLGNVFITLTVNKEKALLLVLSNYSLTTDLADYLSQKSGQPYRLVYKIIGQVVDEAIKSSKPLTVLTSFEIQKVAKLHGVSLEVTDSELKMLLNPEALLDKRKHVGGTSVSTTQKMIGARKEQVKNMEKWVVGQKDKFLKAKVETWKLSQMIINKAQI